MTTESITTGHQDEVYLHRMSLFWLLAGMMFVSEALFIVIKPWVLVLPWLGYLFSVIYLPLIIITLLHFISVIRLMRNIPQFHIWSGDFEDENCKDINDEGIKYSLATLAIFFAVILWIDLYLPTFFVNYFSHVGLNELSTLGIGLVMLSYGLAVVCLLKRNTTNMISNR